MPTKITNTLWPEPSMLLVSGTWGPIKTFKMIPATKECPYVECIYNHQAETLAVIGSIVKDTLHMVSRLDDNGAKQINKATGESKEQRITLSTFSEYYITGKDEIAEFVKKFAINADKFDIKIYLEAPTMEAPNKAGILEGPKKNKAGLILEP